MGESAKGHVLAQVRGAYINLYKLRKTTLYLFSIKNISFEVSFTVLSHKFLKSLSMNSAACPP